MWQARQDSNLQHPDLEFGVLPLELLAYVAPWVGFEPTTLTLAYHFDFCRRSLTVRGLDYPSAMGDDVSFRPPPSSLYTFLFFTGLARDCHQHYLLRVPRI